MSDFRKPRKKSVLDQAKLKMYGEKLEGAKGAPTLSFYLTEAGMPRIDVYTNVDGDKDNGLIRAAMDLDAYAGLMELFQMAINNDSACQWSMDNKNYLWPGGKRSEKPVITSRTIVGQAEDGRIYISVVAKDRPKARFYFQAPFFHPVMDSDGNSLPKGLESKIFAKGYYENITKLMSHVAAATWKEPEKKGGQGGYGGGNRGGNNGGGYGGNGGGGNNYNSSGPETGFNPDDDIPF